MSHGNSKVITSPQSGPHERLLELVVRYQNQSHQRPVPQHTQTSFQAAIHWLGEHNGALILDAGCGTGLSTAYLALQSPEAKVIGLDRSQARLNKHQPVEADNYLLVRADARDFWVLCREVGLRVERLYLLYPNPYPKPTQLQRRWHGNPAMADIMAISNSVEVRSNWKTYCEEFALACAQYGWRSELTRVADSSSVSLFEKKYLESGQACWRVDCCSVNPSL